MHIGIDIGTGSTKGVLVDGDGTILRKESVTHTMSSPSTGWAEFDAQQQWWPEIQQISQRLLEGQDANQVHGVCVSGMGPCLVLMEEDFTPVRAAILYGVDTRAFQEIEDLTDQLGDERIVERCGNSLSSQSIGPKMRWVRDHEPKTFARAVRWGSAHSYILGMLTGEYVLDHHTASQSDPLYDLTAEAWAEDWYDEIAEHLERPRLAWANEAVGAITPEASEATGLPVGTPVCAGTVDAWTEAWSAGVRAPGDTMLQYGSTFFVVQNLRSQAHESQLWSTAGITEGSRCLAAGTATSGSLTSWWRGQWGDPDFEQLVHDAGSVPPGARGLLVLPYFAGERTPIFDPDARGTVIGLTLSHGPAEIFRATYEGIACGLRQILDLLEEGVERPERLVAVGGGTQSRLWVQIVSDVTGRSQQIPDQTIGASYGAAMLAAETTSGIDTRDWACIGETVEPDPQHRELYDEIFGLYTQLYRDNRETMHRLAELQRRSDTPVQA
ncbi:FGGY-family carbohydrate kinase [Kocuria palustris]|uniref:FGGY-family carbohydrate kinase n=1 Tax=Kocuria palustris TaxID=71999 RepID=UPI002044515A|nr:FGGY family carbohydrate kinase [Kocuria palustris]MCM3330468.1 FGGY family carbohydrate kinase [Kocuria palustris]